MATLFLVMWGCYKSKPPHVPAPVGMDKLEPGCRVVNVDTHLEMKCKTDKPGAPPMICWIRSWTYSSKRRNFSEDRLMCSVNGVPF